MESSDGKPIIMSEKTEKKKNNLGNGNFPKTKYIVICGGAISGLGKGITISSTALLLKNAGYRVSIVKIDPYLNIDAGTMNPYEHGECFVLDDGGEVDLDLGNYERYLDVNFTARHNITTGKIYKSILEKERRGDYLGHTVQVVPHVTNEITKWIKSIGQIPVDESGENPEIVLVEVGGTVGDLESSAYFEAIRQMKLDLGEENVIILFLSFVLTVRVSGEQKTKPTQNGMKELRSSGLTPDFIICRSDEPFQKYIREKIALYGSTKTEYVINIPDVKNILEIPILLEKQNFPQLLLEKMKLPPKKFDLTDIKLHLEYLLSLKTQKEKLIVIVGKYTKLEDAYLSIKKSLIYAGNDAGVNVKLHFLESINLEDITRENNKTKFDDAWNILKIADGIVLPGGFGERGIIGKMIAAEYARVNKIPFLGICYGFQLAIINFAKNVLGIEDAASEEYMPEGKNSLVIYMPETSLEIYGGTLRKGAKITNIISKDSLSYKLYGKEKISERHRHRYEINIKYRPQLEAAGLIFTGIDEKQERLEIFELAEHPFYVGVQFHPEYHTRFLKPSPIYMGFVLQVSGLLEKRLEEGGGKLFYSQKWREHNVPDKSKENGEIGEVIVSERKYDKDLEERKLTPAPLSQIEEKN